MGYSAAFGTVRVDPPWDENEDLVEIARGKLEEVEGPRERQYIAADPRFTFGGTEDSCALISPNCPNKL